MSLSDNAIGFYLEVEDVSLSRTLQAATKSYERYTKALEGYNKRAFESSSRGLGQVQALVAAVEELPEAAARAMSGASATIEKQLKPITQKVDLAITVQSATRLKKIVGQAVGEAMSDARVRLTASLPQRRLAMFAQGVGLRAQYADVPQPPDMRGRIQPLKKYAKGGVVDGPPGLDKVFAMLTKGEMVLPADVVKQLGTAGGRTLKTGNLEAKTVQEMIDLTATYGDELADVNEQFQFVGENLDQLSDVTKLRLGGAMLQAVKRTQELEEVAEGAGGSLKRLLVDILGPAKFLAISEGISNLQEGLVSLRAGAGSAFTTLGGQEIDSGIDSINQMNQFLGVSRDELRRIKVRAGDAAEALDGVTFDEFANGLRIAAELGIRNEDVMFDLTRAASTLAKATDIAQESAVELGFELTHSLNMSQEGFEATAASVAQLSDRTSGFNISASKLFSQTTADVAVLNTSLRNLDDIESQRLLGSFNQIGAVLESNFIQAGDLRQVLAKAFEGGPENIDAIRTATLLTGLSQDELRTKLLKGDLEGMFDRIGMQAKNLDPSQLKALASEIGVSSEELGKLSGRLDNINAGFETSKTRIVETGDGLDVLTGRAESNRTAFERLQERFTDWVASTTIFGTSGAEILDWMKEFNLTAVASALYLGTLAKKGLAAAGGFLGFGKAATESAGALAGTGKIAGKVGPMLGKLARTATPLLLVGAAVAFLTNKSIDFMESTNKINKATVEKGEKIGLTEFGAVGADIARVKKNIARVQKTIDLDAATGQDINPSSIALLERYNGQLAAFEERSQGMVDVAKARRGAGLPSDAAANPLAGLDLPPDFAFDPSTFLPEGGAQPVTAAEMAGFLPDPMSTEKQEGLLERMVVLMEEQVRLAKTGGAAASPGPSVQGPSLGVSAFGQSVAGGEL